MMLFIVPPLLFGSYLFESGKSHAPKDVMLQFFSMLVCLPLVLLMITSLFRSIILAIFSFHPPTLFQFNEMHHDLIYNNFIPAYGELFPYWMDLYWGITGVLVLFGMALMDSLRRSMLVRQIENLPTSKVHSAAIGLVELKGKAVPIKGSDNKPIILERFEDKGDGMHGTLTITDPFYLDDGTGRILIEPEGCSVSSTDNAFEINLHHALLKSVTQKTGLSERRLMPGDDVYVLGNLQINDNSKNDADKVIIKPKKFTFDGFNIYDIFFVSNISEKKLLAACKKAITHGWKGVFLTMMIPAWLAINGWTNITQLQSLDIEAAPLLFRVFTTATTLERPISVGFIGKHPPAYWLDRLEQTHEKTDNIMWALKKQHLENLAIPIFTKQAMDIDHPAFAIANIWLQKLRAAPSGHRWHEYQSKKNSEYYEKKKKTFVDRVSLNYKKPKLFASYRAYFGKVKSEQLELTKRYVVFEFTHKQTGEIKKMQFFSKDGWNIVKNVEVFKYFLPGEYNLDIYTKRHYRNGESDKGELHNESIDIKL